MRPASANSSASWTPVWPEPTTSTSPGGRSDSRRYPCEWTCARRAGSAAAISGMCGAWNAPIATMTFEAMTVPALVSTTKPPAESGLAATFVTAVPVTTGALTVSA